MRYCFWFPLLTLLIFFAGCNNSTNEESDNSLSDIPWEVPGKIINTDTLEKPKVYVAPEPVVSPAYIVERIDHEKIQKEYSSPERIRAKDPEKITSGVLSAVKVAASPEVRKASLPEIVKLKEAANKDNNFYSFISHSKVQGLLHDDIIGFYEDQSGNMWIASYGGGIMRFDGNHLAYYQKAIGAEIPTISQIQGDGEGNLWIATARGLFKFDGHSTFFYDSDKGGLADNALQSLKIDNSGNLWISYRKGGISMFDGTHFYHYSQEQGLPPEKGQILISDNSGNIWISSPEGLFMFKEGSFYKFEVPMISEVHPIISLNIDNEDNIWFSLYEIGVVRFDGTFFDYYTVEEGFPSGKVVRTMQDSQERLWFCTWGDGLILLDDSEKYKIFGQKQGIPSDLISEVYEDKNGILWIGSFGGMSRFYGDIFNHFQVKPGFDQVISSIARSKDGKLWLSADEGGIVSFDGEQFVQYSSNSKNDDVLMEGLIPDSKGNLWLSIDEQGIFRFDKKNFYHYVLDQITVPVFIHDGLEDSKGNLWFLIGEQGILKFDGKHFTHFTRENGLPSDYAHTLCEDRDGNLWFGTSGSGAFKYDGSDFTCFTTEDGLGSDYIFSLFGDSHGNIWFGTDGDGLSFFNGKTITNFSSRDGLTDNYIFSITQDQDGNMIFGGRFGLNLMSYSNFMKLTETDLSLPNVAGMIEEALFINYTYEDGFLGVGCNLGAILRDENQIWIGTNDRLTSFFPQAAFYEKNAPQVRINQIELFNEHLNWERLFNSQDTSITLANGVRLSGFRLTGLEPWYQIPENLVLAHDNNFITFYFSGISTSSGGKLLYSYILEGFDKNWHRPTPDNSVHYGNLPAGEYTLKVKAMNRMGSWSEDATFFFKIKTPWWETWWAWLFYLILASLIFIYIIKSREKSLVLENKILDNEVELARKTIEIKQNIIANVSHELRTPLTGILGITEILGKTRLDDTQKEFLLTLQQSGNNLREIINQILDYSKIESGEINLKNVNFSVEELFSNATKMFASLNREKEEVVIKTFIHPGIPKLLNGDCGRITQILNNLLFNAVKFTHEGSISLEAQVEQLVSGDPSKEDDFLIKISVKDTGVGISDDAMDRLFLPFSQIEVKDTRDYDSTGLGLAISKKLAELLHGEIGVESEEGKGSHFWYTFRAKSVKAIQTKTTGTLKQPCFTSKRILLVEDKKINQMVIKLILEGMGHEVVLADNGRQALDIFKPGNFDSIFMDIQMPVMDGITATKELKQLHKILPPIIGLSANAFDGDREKYMGLGMDEYITKPVTEDSLLKILEKVSSN